MLINSQADIRLSTMIGVGYLERYLGELIDIQLANLPVAARQFLFKGSIKHIGARIDFAVTLALVEQTVAKDLKTLVDIRNRFSHHVHARDCTDPVVKQLIGKLRFTREVIEENEADPSNYPDEDHLRMMIASSVEVLHELMERPYN